MQLMAGREQKEIGQAFLLERLYLCHASPCAADSNEPQMASRCQQGGCFLELMAAPAAQRQGGPSKQTQAQERAW